MTNGGWVLSADRNKEVVMWGLRIVMVVAAASILSGCAGGQTRQELARLQSQVGLLDERITQLERSNLSELSTDSFGESSADAGTAAGDVGAPQKAPSARQQPLAKPSLKPSTTEIQQALKNAGFYQGAVDGKMGPLTREAVREFQRVHGLTDDGVVGKVTWAKLRAYADLSAGSGELNAAEILK
jgi:murein L,D-transpeptidase YcbB/YkuD